LPYAKPPNLILKSSHLNL